MHVEMTCGRCEAAFSLETDEQDPFWTLVQRFASAHAECGYMASAPLLGDPPMRKVVLPRLVGEAGEA